MTQIKNPRNVTLTTEISDGWTITTYVGTAKLPTGIALSSAVAMPIWQVTKYVETTTEGTSETMQYRPIDDDGDITMDYLFIRNNRTSLDYN